MPQLVISAKHLGDFAIQGACPRCLWVGLHVRRLPCQTVPGIFSFIASYNEPVVEAYFQREKKLPQWLSSLGEVESCLSPPSYHRFFAVDPSTGAMLRGKADGHLLDEGLLLHHRRLQEGQIYAEPRRSLPRL